jgi:hypothetical protein
MAIVDATFTSLWHIVSAVRVLGRDVYAVAVTDRALARKGFRSRDAMSPHNVRMRMSSRG